MLFKASLLSLLYLIGIVSGTNKLFKRVFESPPSPVLPEFSMKAESVDIPFNIPVLVAEHFQAHDHIQQQIQVEDNSVFVPSLGQPEFLSTPTANNSK